MTYSTAQTFYVVECGASGHNIRSQPNLKALPVGKFKLGSSFLVTEKVLFSCHSVMLNSYNHVVLQKQTLEGVWVKLLHTSSRQYCFNNELEAWSLAVDRHNVIYLKHEDEVLSGN